MQTPKILYEDDNLIVCYKPAGVATQTKRLGQQDMESILKNYVASELQKQGKNAAPYIGIVHRLDQPVEGVMVYAKNPKAAAVLSKQVQERSIGKNYYALVQLSDGKTFAETTGLASEGTREDFMTFDRRMNVSKIVPKGTKDAKKAVLDYKVVAEADGKALLDITLHTGRHHQIRLQMAGMGTPIIETVSMDEAMPRCWDFARIVSPLSVRQMVRIMCIKFSRKMQKFQHFSSSKRMLLKKPDL